MSPQHPATLLAGLLLVAGCGGGEAPAPPPEPAPTVVPRAATTAASKARLLARGDRLVEAVAEAERAVQAAPAWVDARCLAGELQRRLGAEIGAGRDDRDGHYALARAHLERAIELDGAAAAPRIELATLVADTGQTDAAIALLEPIANPDHPVALFHLASIYLMNGEAGRARDMFAAGLARRPDDARAQLSYGIASVRSGHLEQGRDALAEAIRLRPDDHDAWLQYGLVLGKLGDTQHQLLSHARAAYLSPRSEQAMHSLALAARRAGREAIAQGASRRYDKLVEARQRVKHLQERLGGLDQPDPDLLRQLATALLQRGRQVKAQAAIDHVLRMRPRDPDARCVRASIDLDAGRLDQAAENLAAALEVAPEHARAYALRGRLRLALGSADGAMVDLQKARQLGYESEDLYVAMSRAALAAGQPDIALEAANAGLRRYPEHVVLFRLAAAALLGRGDAAQASRLLIAYNQHLPGNDRVLRQLIELARASGHTKLLAEMQATLHFFREGPSR